MSLRIGETEPGPGVETPGYFQMSLPGQNIQCALLHRSESARIDLYAVSLSPLKPKQHLLGVDESPRYRR
jgi:hypothetical protein